MKITASTILAALAATGGTLSVGMAQADPAVTNVAAATSDVHTLGSPAQIGDGTWTVSGLKTSSDTIPYHVSGTLWEATAADEATHGSTTPVVSNFNARARSGQTYRELFLVATPQGVNPAGLGPGQKTSGKLYFDVTGDSPDSVTYNAGGPDLAVWVQPPPTTGGASHGGSGRASNATAVPAAVAPSTAVPAANPGSAGTVIPGNAQGTPLPAGTPGGPQSPAAGTPAPGEPVAPAPGAPATPAPAGAPQPGAPAAPVSPAPGAPAPAPTAPTSGSQGTPVEPGTEPIAPAVQAPPAQQPSTAPAASTQGTGSAAGTPAGPPASAPTP